MKNIFLLLGFLLLCNVLLAQNGTYRCNLQRFTDDNDPSKNKEHNNSVIVTIEINEITGGSIIVNYLNDNTIYKWIILNKIDVNINDQGSKYTSYEARFSYENVQANKRTLAVIIQDPNSLHLVFYNPEVNTGNWYHNLTKINY
jgi:hypothetical protein